LLYVVYLISLQYIRVVSLNIWR